MPGSGSRVSRGVSILGLQRRVWGEQEDKGPLVSHCAVKNADIFQCFCDTTLTGQMFLSSGGARWVPGFLSSGTDGNTASAQSSRFPDLPTPLASHKSGMETSRVWGHSPRTKYPVRRNPPISLQLISHLPTQGSSCPPPNPSQPPGAGPWGQVAKSEYFLSTAIWCNYLKVNNLLCQLNII